MSVSDVVQNGADEGILLRERMTKGMAWSVAWLL